MRSLLVIWPARVTDIIVAPTTGLEKFGVGHAVDIPATVDTSVASHLNSEITGVARGHILSITPTLHIRIKSSQRGERHYIGNKRATC
jgi:hypothetical protein